MTTEPSLELHCNGDMLAANFSMTHLPFCWSEGAHAEAASPISQSDTAGDRLVCLSVRARLSVFRCCVCLSVLLLVCPTCFPLSVCLSASLLVKSHL